MTLFKQRRVLAHAERPGLAASGGFTLVEIITVLMLLGLLLTLIVPMLAGVTGNAAVISTLDEMREIQKAINQRFYPDLGLIPEDLGLGPDGVQGTGDDTVPDQKLATRYLCIKDDGGAGYGSERQEMLDFLTDKGKADLIDWDRHSCKGWRGSYMQADGRYDTGAPGVWFPVLRDAWGNPYEMGILQGGSDKDSFILSYGADGERGNPGNQAADIEVGDNIVIYLFGARAVRYPAGFDPANWGQ